MKRMSLEERAKLYQQAFPKYPPVVVAGNWLYGVWMIGNDYRGSGYYGAYPPSFRERVLSMFPDAESLLHLFSGSLKWDDVKDDATNVFRFDSREELRPEALKKGVVADANATRPEIIGDAHELSKIVGAKNLTFDLIMADPPYSEEDALHYGQPMVNRNKVVQECVKVLRPGGFLVWLDQVLPMYRKVELALVGTIGIVRSTNHRFRVVSIFERLQGDGGA